jgi:hypothetical protein
MRVKLCARCPYTPRDLANHYDPDAGLHACAKCDGKYDMSDRHYPRVAQRRQRCATIHNIVEMAQRNAAPPVMESLVSSGTTAGELPSVRRLALVASRPARSATVDG